MRLVRVDMQTDVPLSFRAALIAADAVEVDAEEHPYAPVAGTDREALIVNRVTTDGTTWTAVAVVTPDRTAVRIRFVKGAGRRGTMFEIPHGSGTRITEIQSRATVSLVLAAPRELARRLCSGDVGLDRLIEAAWRGSRALQLAPAEYRALERRLVAADEDASEAIRCDRNPVCSSTALTRSRGHGS